MSVAFGTFCATLLGGVAALHFRDRLHLILGFSAGTVVALSFFDLLPESLHLAGNHYAAQTLLAVAALAFFGYTVLDRLLLAHGDDGRGQRHAPGRARAGAGSLSAHSLMDGVALGMGFQASTSIGIVVAVAILTHDCSDGMNTVSVVLKNGGARREAMVWLGVDATAPLAGAAASLFARPSESDLALVLAAFAGFFLYIGASDLLPESFHTHPKMQTTLATLAGAGILYLVVQLAQ
ncbi:MAG: ZIP family metal transporter [Rhizomicrobium sp.]